jgi:zinc transport system substrate-binding protein
MRLTSPSIGLILLLCLVFGMARQGAAAPKTVVTIKPIHSLVSGVMAGIAKPVLLVNGAGSPHGYTMRPSQARALSAADLVIWVGPEMESFFINPAKSLNKTTKLLTLLDRKELTRISARHGGAWEDHEDEEAHGEGEAANHTNDGQSVDGHSWDAHPWLDPANGRVIVTLVADALSTLDPNNAPAYQANAMRMMRELQGLEQEIVGILAPVRNVPYVVFHDAYQYFEARFRTNAVGSISISPDRRPSARRMLEIRRKIKETDAACVFAEPQFAPRLVETAREGTSARAAILDPLGAALEAGPGAYSELLRDLAISLVSCLEGKN